MFAIARGVSSIHGQSDFLVHLISMDWEAVYLIQGHGKFDDANIPGTFLSLIFILIFKFFVTFTFEEFDHIVHRSAHSSPINSTNRGHGIPFNVAGHPTYSGS